jgi:hypothetical protein
VLNELAQSSLFRETGSGLGIAVVHRDGHYRVMATRAIAAGAVICPITGTRTSRPTRWTLQVGVRAHIEADPAATLEEQIERFPWRFLNHSCDPNARIAGLEVVALRPIEPGEELTFNYNSTEFDMVSPFACHCDSSACEGTIRGFAHLPPAEQARLRPYLAAHLGRKLARRRVHARTPKAVPA